MGTKEELRYWEAADRSWSEDSVWFSNTPSGAIRQTFFYVQEVGFFRTVPPYYTQRANLNSFLLFHTLSGKGILENSAGTFELLPGTVALVNCMEYHHYFCAPESNWEFQWLHFNGPTALGYYEALMKNGYGICTGQDDALVKTTMEQILTLTQHKTVHSEIQVSGLITQLLTHLLMTAGSEASAASAMPAYIKSILKKIDHHFGEPLSLDTLSAEFGVSKFHLAREFKRCTGTTVNEYLTVTRLNRAKELLKYTAITVEQVAFSCGFHHVSHFINVFRAHEGSTPLQFRKQWSKG